MQSQLLMRSFLNFHAQIGNCFWWLSEFSYIIASFINFKVTDFVVLLLSCNKKERKSKSKSIAIAWLSYCHF
ncbi:unnamed protein product [Blepharisma stoltei]|uniref:Uncharacterized protein n=1 Tax=Blepharisma stoltei TaxID=1481888 RepID=A0AAU9JTX6_9CILI|nr:unnamed protein product [Blepharisma stoltei]